MKLSALIPALAIVGATTVVHTQQPVPFEGERHVRVMTRNVYHGVNTQIFDVPNATSVADLLSKVAAVYSGYFASNFQERAMAGSRRRRAVSGKLGPYQHCFLNADPVRSGRLNHDPSARALSVSGWLWRKA
jgi:hypothetical protein